MSTIENGVTVAQLIAMLNQCDPAAKVVYDYDDSDQAVCNLERRPDGVVELRSDGPKWAETYPW